MKKLFWILLPILFLSPLLGQTEVKNHDKKALVNSIFLRLINAHENKAIAIPNPEVITTTSKGAFFNIPLSKIFIEEKALRVCSTFGDREPDAIAAIISHEIIHYTENHGKDLAYLSKSWGFLSSAEIWEKEEEEADFLGIMLSHAAGFKTLDILPKLFEKLYEVYPYASPSLNTRQKWIEKASLDAKELLKSYELATYLTLFKQYEASIEYLFFVSKKFKSRELFNNLGVNHVLYSLQELSASQPKYVYPLELDPILRLEGGAVRKLNEEGLLKIKNTLEFNAIRYFEIAINFDHRYLPAYINLACTYDLLSHLSSLLDLNSEAIYFHKRSLDYLNQYENLMTFYDSSKTESILNITKGTIFARMGQKKLAKEFFKIARKESDYKYSPILKINEAILNEAKTQINSGEDNKDRTRVVEKIEGIEPEYFEENLDTFFTIKDIRGLRIVELNLSYNWMEFDSSYIVVSKEQRPDRTITTSFLVTMHDYDGATAYGVSIGDHVRKIETKYGTAHQKLSTPDGYFLIFYDNPANIIFQIDENNSISRWILFESVID